MVNDFNKCKRTMDFTLNIGIYYNALASNITHAHLKIIHECGSENVYCI